MLPSPMWGCVTLLMHDAENGCLRGLLLYALEQSYSFMMSSGLGKYIMCFAYLLWWYVIMEESQKHSCSFFCWINVMTVWVKSRHGPGEHISCHLNERQLRRTGTRNVIIIIVRYWVFLLNVHCCCLKVCFSHTSLHHGWCKRPSDTTLFFIVDLQVPWWAHVLTQVACFWGVYGKRDLML